MWKLECLDDQIGIDAEDSVSLVLVFNKHLCERWGQLNGPTGCLATDSCKEMVLMDANMYYNIYNLQH